MARNWQEVLQLCPDRMPLSSRKAPANTPAAEPVKSSITRAVLSLTTAIHRRVRLIPIPAPSTTAHSARFQKTLEREKPIRLRASMQTAITTRSSTYCLSFSFSHRMQATAAPSTIRARSMATYGTPTVRFTLISSQITLSMLTGRAAAKNTSIVTII